MGQLKKLYAALSMQQRIAIVAAVIVVGAAIYGVLTVSHNRSFRPLFTGMSPEDAAAIVAKLKESGVEHRIGDNGSTVLVPDSKVDELRLEMAGAGLPKTGRVGFELFDRTNLGITDFTEHVNYRRALEGELERSIKALSEVDQARVHLTFSKDSVYLDLREPAKASVLISTKPGAHLSPQNVLAVTNLVASAVEGLTPESVSLLDMQGNLLNRPLKHLNDDSAPSEEALNYKHQIEKDLVTKIESTLDPLLGEGKFRVAVSADCDFSTSEQSEEILDPTHSVMLTSQKMEDVAGTAQPAGVPGTSSNLPRAVPRAVGSSMNSSRRTENVAYETSKTVRHVKMPQGAIKRLSASLLLDQDVRWEGKGKNRQRVIVPPSPEKLKIINDLVSGVIGLTPERGDRLVVESLPFEQTVAAEAVSDVAGPAAPALPKDQLGTLMKDRRVLIGAGAVLVFVLLGGFFVLRRKPKAIRVETAAALPQAANGGALGSAQTSDSAVPELETAGASLQLPPMTTKIESLRLQAKENVKKDSEMAADVLRGWLASSD